MPAPFVLSIQSEVVYGHVGQGAARFALQRLGFEVLALPTVLFSNHPGHGGMTGEAIPAGRLRDLLRGLKERGLMGQVAGVLSGYLGMADQAEVVAEAIAAVKAANPAALYLCDPVFGDEDGAYAKLGVAEAMARSLVPVADIITPNRFELTSLTARPVKGPDDAWAALRSLGRPEGLVTSVPMPGGAIGTLAVQGPAAWLSEAPRVERPPHGTGDLLAALYLGHRLKGEAVPEALGRASGAVDRLIREAVAAGSPELGLIEGQTALTDASALAVLGLSS